MARQNDDVRLAALALLNIADDKGYFIAEPAIIRSAIWPFDEDSTRARRVLATLSDVGWIELRNHPQHGQIGCVVNFTKHQRIDRPSTSKIATYFLDEHSTNTRRSIEDRSSLEQGTGNRDQGTREQGAETVAEGSPAARKPRKPNLTDEEFLSELGSDPTYAGIDVMIEHGKMLNWCSVRRKQPTRARFINWLNGAEKPMHGGKASGNHRNDTIGGGDIWDAEANRQAELGFDNVPA